MCSTQSRYDYIILRWCDKWLNVLILLGCYTEKDICNGKKECDDGFDESDCGDPSVLQQDQTLRFRLSR